MKVMLTVTDGPHRGASFSFLEHDAFLMGHSPEVQFRLPLKDETLSPVHSLVEVNSPSCRLMDMDSTNGVRVNGKPVHAADLRDGDVIRAGRTTLAFAVEDRDPGPAAPAERRLLDAGAGPALRALDADDAHRPGPLRPCGPFGFGPLEPTRPTVASPGSRPE